MPTYRSVSPAEAERAFNRGEKVELKVFGKATGTVHDWKPVTEFHDHTVSVKGDTWNKESTQWATKQYRVEFGHETKRVHIEYEKDGWKYSLDREVRMLDGARCEITIPADLIIVDITVDSTRISIQARPA